MLWKTCLIILFAFQLSACTLVGLTLDSKICGHDDKNNSGGFSHNQTEPNEDECQFIFTSLGAVIDYSVFKSLTSTKSSATSHPDYEPTYQDNEYSGISCPAGEKKICFVKKGCHCVNDSR